jgi:DNA replication and repair protein RecF
MISCLHIRGFKGYKDIQIDLSQQTSIIGANGSGKTHILEGIHIASGGICQYIQWPREASMFLEISYTSDIWSKKFTREREENRERYRIQWANVSGKKYLNDLPYRTVFISPFDMNIFYFSPSARREFIDDILSRAYSQFTWVRREYENIVRQRNALLKKIREGEAGISDLKYWDNIFAEKAHVYHLYRMKWNKFLEEHMDIVKSLLPKYTLTFRYASKIEEKIQEYNNTDIIDVILQYLQEHQQKDIISGHTHIWPHLDDYSFHVTGNRDGAFENTIESALYLSRWENKVLLLAWKQIEILFLKSCLGIPIILLFDDIFAELDFLYAEQVISILRAQQVIITSQRPLPEWKKWTHFSCINLNTAYYHAESTVPIHG